MFRRVLAFITNAGARRATQFRLLLWRGKDQKTSSKKKSRSVGRVGGREEHFKIGERVRAGTKAERERERERTREEKKVTSTYKLVVGRETTKSKKKFQNKKL